MNGMQGLHHFNNDYMRGDLGNVFPLQHIEVNSSFHLSSTTPSTNQKYAFNNSM
jgi:hypothetical protein